MAVCSLFWIVSIRYALLLVQVVAKATTFGREFVVRYDAVDYVFFVIRLRWCGRRYSVSAKYLPAIWLTLIENGANRSNHVVSLELFRSTDRIFLLAYSPPRIFL